MNTSELLNHPMAKKFISMVKTGSIIAPVIIPESIGSKEQDVFLSMSPQARSVCRSKLWPLFGHRDTFTTDWKHKHLSHRRIMLYRSNGLCVQFVSHTPGGGKGGLNYGLCASEEHSFNVVGGWSSRPSVLRKHTGVETIEIYMDNTWCYLLKEIADVIAPMVGLRVDVSKRYGRPEDNEIAYAFFRA